MNATLKNTDDGRIDERRVYANVTGTTVLSR
jgi:hypothetical protein